ncbi:MAG TPA: arginine N-succinyltransferase [Anaeromyxobacteraceae bacterium]|nr:arginine N-succinyltransferase [Anaeromyxobacteraceae bacterium]
MYLLRNALRSDLQDLKVLARMLDTVNLPDDERALSAILDESARSFDGRIRDALRRRYVFALEDVRRRRVVGTSMIIAQHGTRESPCTFFELSDREHYSSTLDRWFKHQVLSIGYHFHGPTEIGGLVVHPRARRGEARPGKQLSFVRFLYVAMHRDRFRDRMLAELMPPLTADGKSLFWESCGRRFTGLDYQEADKLSRRNKEFIQQLFPPGDLYATVFPPRVRRLLGAVGPATEGARRMLERIGFRRVRRIDPFDGGPHYECATDEVALVRDCRRLAVAEGEPPPGAAPLLVGTDSRSGRIRFRAVRAEAAVEGGRVRLPAEARRLLRVRAGDRVSAVPFA